MRKLNDNLDQLLNDYNHINTSKASLEYELQVYKRLLDSQLDRLNCNSEQKECVSRKTIITTSACPPPQQQQQAQQPQCVDPCAGLNQTSVSSNAFGGKVQNKKEKKGAIGIADCSPDGKFIIIENMYSVNINNNNSSSCNNNLLTSAQQSTNQANPNNFNNTPVDLSGWVIRRKVDGNQELTFRIPNGILLPPNREVTIWSSGSYKLSTSTQSTKSSSAVDLVADFENWGIGINSITRLINQGGEEKSSFYQHISFSSQY